MSYDLRTESWIPFRRRAGNVDWGPPSLLTDRISENPVTGIASPRPDFDGALLEFLTGLLTTAFARAELLPDEAAWLRFWKEPPSSKQLAELFMALPPAFYLDGDGPCFMQDASPDDFAGEEERRAEQLLMDAPGKKPLEDNTDVFVKRDRVRVLGLPAAAMAVLALQTYAPAGGSGNLTSLRGGGPLTTLNDPRASAVWDALWYKLWSNVETELRWQERAVGEPRRQDSDLFPWLATTRTSETGMITAPGDAHPLQCYFGMPRRLRLTFGGPGVCALTGIASDMTVTGFRMRPRGVKYVGWEHPFSPHYRSTKGDTLPMHGQAGGIGWRDWLGLTLRKPDGRRSPASVVAHFISRRAERVNALSFRVHAFGYDFDKMKAREWGDSPVPAFAGDEKHVGLLRDAADRMTSGTEVAASALVFAVKLGRFAKLDDAPASSPVWESLKSGLWRVTEASFYESLRGILETGSESFATDTCISRFHSVLEREALAAFDRVTTADAETPAAIRRFVVARYGLSSTLRGFGKQGGKLFQAFRLPAPETRPERQRANAGAGGQP